MRPGQCQTRSKGQTWQAWFHCVYNKYIRPNNDNVNHIMTSNDELCLYDVTYYDEKWTWNFEMYVTVYNGTAPYLD